MGKQREMQGGGEAGESQSFEERLSERLSLLESPDYSDPARKDIPALDLLLLTSMIVVVSAILVWWVV